MSQISNPDLLANLKESQTAENPAIQARMKHFLSSIGVDFRQVDEILDKTGRKINAYGVAKISEKVVEVLKGTRGIEVLPEEAAHFFVAMMPETSKLKSAMMKNITNYKVYQEVVEDYSELYKGNQEALKIEAIGKLISQHIVSQSMGTEFTPELSERQERQMKTWWAQLVKFLKQTFGLVNSDPFAKSAYDMLHKDLSELDITTQQDVEQDEQFSLSRGDNYTRLEAARRNRERRERERMRIQEINEQELIEKEFKKELPLTSGRELVRTQFDQIFPNFSYMSNEEKDAFVDGMTSGEIETYCGL
jgi:hypothetical protein